MTFSSRRKVRRQLSKPNYQTAARLRLPKAARLFLETLEDRVVPSTFKWVGTGANGNWDTAANWMLVTGSGTFPNAVGDLAQFTSTTATQLTATLDIPVTVGEIDFGSSQNYTISSSAAVNTLTLQATSGNAVLKTLTSPANTGTDVIAAQVLVNAGTPLNATLAQGTLKLTNVSAANPNTVTGTFTVMGGTLEGFSTQTANTDALGTANVVLGGGALKVDPIPSTFSTSGVTGRYFNTGFTAANNGTSPAVGQIDYSGTPGATRSDANINFTNFTTSGVLPTGVSTNAGTGNTNNNFAVEWVGGLNILTGGSYTFTDQSDDGSQLVIDGTAVVTNNSNTTQTGTATLTAGVHSFEVRYYQGSGGTNQVISYNGPDTSSTTVVIPGAASLSASGLFQYAAGSTATFTNNVTVNASTTGTIDMSLAAMDATLGTLTTGAGSTLNVVGSTTGRTANFGNVTLGGATTFNPTTANVTLGAVTDGGSNFALTKTGAGTLSLNAAASTFAGTTTLNGGTLALGNAAALGAGGLSVTAGAVVINASGALGTTINLTAGETLVANTANVLNGVTVNVPAGAIVQGVNANALAGAIINLNGGGLSVRADASAAIGGTINVNSNSSVIDVNRVGVNVTAQTLSVASLSMANGVTTLNVTGSAAANFTLQTAGAFTLPTNNITINTVDANFNFGGAITGTTSITKVGVGALTFSADSTGWAVSGGSTLLIQQGTANVATANGAGAGGSTVTLQGGTLALSSSAATTYTMAVALDPTIQIGLISNVNNVGNTISGALTIAPGQQLQTVGQNTITLTAALATAAGNYSFNTNGSSIQFNGQITGSGTLVKLGGSTLTLGASGGSTANTYTGGTIANAGTLQANGVVGGSLNNLGTGPVTVNGGQLNLFADLNQNNVYTNNIAVTNNATIGFGRTGSSSVANSIIYLTGTLSLTNNTVTFNQNNNYNFAVSGATTLLGNVSIAGNGGVIFSGAVGDGGNGYGVTKTATNTVIINGVSTYTGDTRINSGTLGITSAGKIASGNVFIEPGAGLALPSATGWYSGATQPNILMTSNDAALAEVQLNYNGALPTMAGGTAPTGGVSGGVIALGLNLNLPGPTASINIAASGSNSAIIMTAFAGPVTQNINLGGIGDGTFYLGAASNITYTGTLTTSSTTLRLGAGGAQLALGGSNVLADNGSATTLVVGASLANGTGTLTNGTGTLVLLNNNTYTGGTLVNRSSTLVISTTATASASPLGTGAVTVYGTLTAAGASGTFLANGSTTLNTNAITLNPGSILRFDNTNAFQGVSAGNNTNRWGDSVAVALNGSTLELLANNNASSTTETVGAVTFDKGSVISVKRNTTGTAKLTVASLTRVNRGTLTIVTSAANTLGAASNGDWLIDTNNATDLTSTNVNTGDTNADAMAQAYYLDGTDNAFVKYTANGFAATKFASSARTLLNTVSTNNDVLDVTAAVAITANASPWAMRVGAVAITGGFNISLQSGAVVFTGSATHASNFVYGATGTAEGLIYTANGATVQHTGTDTTTGGLTKFGQGLYSLQGANTGLSGGLVNNANSNSGTSTVGTVAGTLELKTNSQAGGPTATPNLITLNGGQFNLRYDSSTTLTNSIVVASLADVTISADRAGTTATGQTLGFAQLTVGNSTVSFASGDAYLFTISGAVTLTGNATISTGGVNTSNALTVTGGLTDGGSGFGLTKTGGNTLTINGSGTTSGATSVLAGTLTLGAFIVIGNATTPTIVDAGATLNLTAAGNLASGNVITVNSNNVGLGALGISYNAALPTITAGSSGVLGINTLYNVANLNLAMIGNGTFFLGSTTGGTYAGGTLTIGAGNIWRLGGGGSTLTISNNIITDGNPVLIGSGLANGTAAVTNGGGTVAFNVAQTYTGTTTITAASVTYLNGNAANNNTGSNILALLLTNAGSGYTSAPTVGFSGGGGSGATATATLSVLSVMITNGGSGYTSAPTVTFSAPSSGTTATGVAVLSGGVVVGVVITNAGSGYTSVPTITFGSGAATATAVMQVGALSVSAGGTGYTSAPTVTISGGGGTGASANALAGVQSQTLTGNIFLKGNATINIGPGGQNFSSVFLTIQGQINYGGNTLTLNNGVVSVTGGAATGTGNTVLGGGVALQLSNMNQLASGNLNLSNGTFILGADSGSGVAPSWAQFMAFFSGGYGLGMNQWQITSSTGGFAGKGNPGTDTVTISIPSGAYGYVTAQTVFDRDFRLGTERRGNLTGAAGSQVFYANLPVNLAQNISLDGIRNISIAPTGPGISGAAGTGVVNRITGNLSGFGVPHFQTFDVEQAPTGSNYTEAPEVVLAGLNTWTGNPGNVQGVNAGAGGLVLDQNVFVRFASNASLPTGNNGAPALLAAVRDNQNSYGGGYLLTSGSTYTMPAGLSFLFGETVVGSGNIRTSVLGSTSDAGGGGMATLQNVTILIANASGVTGGGLVELSPSNTQTLSLLSRDGTFNLGAGANAVTFQYATEYFYSNSNLYVGDGILNTLNLGTASSANSFGVADAQAGTGRRPLEKDGSGTIILNNVAYTFPVAGTTAATNFAWNIGNSTTLGGTLQLGAANQIPAVAINVVNGLLDLNSFSTTITSLSMGGGPVGSTSTVNTETATLTLGGNVTFNNTNNAGAGTINGNLALGSSTRTFTINHSTANTTDLTVNAVISGSGGLTMAGAGQLLLTAANTYTGTTTINSGTLVVGANAPSGAAGALGNATGAVLLGNTTGSSNAALLIGGAFTVGRAITVQAGNTGTNTLGGSTANASVFSGNLTVNNTGGVTLTSATGSSVTFSGVISGANPITAAGPGTVVLSNTANTYTGVTTISGGILSISNDRNLGADPGSATAGNVVINGGTLQATATFTLNSNRGIAVGPATGSGSGTIDVTGSNLLTYGGIIANNSTGTGSLVKMDTGTLVLTGADTYSGTTAINQGTLLANNSTGSATGTGAVTVANGGTLGGSGTVSGAVTVASGGTVNPGTAAVGTLTVGSADFSGGGTLVIRLPAFGTPGTNYSQLNVTGALTLGGTSALTLDLNGLTTTGTANSVVAAGSITGNFTTTSTINTPPHYTATVAYTATAVNVTIGIVEHFKFNYPGNVAPAGYISVLPTTTYTVGQGHGWQSTAGLGAQDRHGPTQLLQDLIAGADNTFLVDVPAPGTYAVTLTMGDLNYAHGPIDVIANGVDEFAANPILEPLGQFVTPSFTVTITGTQLQLEIKRIGGDPFWAVNAIDIRSAPIGTITLMASPPTITGDGMATSTISGTSSLPQGSLVTVSTSLGTIITADADPNYAGVQVMVGAGGAFSFTVRAPSVGGTATITAQEVTGAAAGSTTLTITPPTTFHFKFNNPGNTAPAGYVSVLPTTTFSAGGFGWQSTTGLGAQDRHGPTPLLQDFVAGPDNTFHVVLPNGSYLVNLTMGDENYAHGPIDVIANGVDEFGGNLILEQVGQFVTRSFVVNVTSGNMLNLEIKRVGGDPFWTINALDIVPASSAVGAITLMSSVATINADGTSTATITGTGAKPNSLITVTASLGTITTADADPNYAGIQVRADGSGNFSFVIQAPTSAGGAVVITANDVTGAATGASSTILTIVPPSVFHFQFVYPYNVQRQSGYQSVFPTDVYSAAAGYGWATTEAGGQYRTSNPFLGTPGLENLQRGLQADHDDTFRILVHVTGVNHFSVTLYLGDNDLPHNQTVVIGGSAGTINEGNIQTGVDDPNPANIKGGFVIMAFSIPASDFTPDANGNDILTIHLTGIASLHDPGDVFFSINGVDVVASTTPAPGPGQGLAPLAAALASDPTTAGGSTVTVGAVPASLLAGSGTGVVDAGLGASASAAPPSTAAPGSAALAVSQQSSADAADWPLQGEALLSPGHAEIRALATQRAGGHATNGRPEGGSRTVTPTGTWSLGGSTPHHLVHQRLAAQGWNHDPLEVLDRVFTDMASDE